MQKDIQIDRAKHALPLPSQCPLPCLKIPVPVMLMTLLVHTSMGVGEPCVIPTAVAFTNSAYVRLEPPMVMVLVQARVSGTPSTDQK